MEIVLREGRMFGEEDALRSWLRRRSGRVCGACEEVRSRRELMGASCWESERVMGREVTFLMERLRTAEKPS